MVVLMRKSVPAERLSRFISNTVWCKYSNELYDFDLKDITDDLFVKSATSYNLSIFLVTGLTTIKFCLAGLIEKLGDERLWR